MWASSELAMELTTASQPSGNFGSGTKNAWFTPFDWLIFDVRKACGPKRQTIALEGAVHGLRRRIGHGSCGRTNHEEAGDDCEGGNRRHQTTGERSRTAEHRPGCAALS